MTDLTPRRRVRVRQSFLAVALLVTVVAATTACTGRLKGGPAGPRVMIVGDSVMYDLAPHVGAALGGRPFKNSTVLGCPIVRGLTLDWGGRPYPSAHDCNNNIWPGHQQHLDEFGPDIVVWLGLWEELPRSVGGVAFTPGGWEGIGLTGAEADTRLISLINEKVAQLTSRGATIAMVTMPPPVPESPGHSDNSFMFEPPTRLDVRTEHLNVILRYVASIHPGVVKLVDFASVACPPAGRAPCPTYIAGVAEPLRPDGAHFGAQGSAWAAATLVPMILS